MALQEETVTRRRPRASRKRKAKKHHQKAMTETAPKKMLFSEWLGIKSFVDGGSDDDDEEDDRE